MWMQGSLGGQANVLAYHGFSFSGGALLLLDMVRIHNYQFAYPTNGCSTGAVTHSQELNWAPNGA